MNPDEQMMRDNIDQLKLEVRGAVGQVVGKSGKLGGMRQS